MFPFQSPAGEAPFVGPGVWRMDRASLLTRSGEPGSGTRNHFFLYAQRIRTTWFAKSITRAGCIYGQSLVALARQPPPTTVSTFARGAVAPPPPLTTPSRRYI